VRLRRRRALFRAGSPRASGCCREAVKDELRQAVADELNAVKASIGAHGLDPLGAPPLGLPPRDLRMRLARLGGKAGELLVDEG